MATTRLFQDMLNDYLPNSLFKEELIRRDYILNHVKKDNKWLGGSIPVPFKAAGASSIKLGGITAADDIASSKYVRGILSGYKEVWGSLIFNHADIIQHGKVSEQNFVNVLPDTIDDFMTYFKEVVSIQLGTGPSFASITDVTNANVGKLIVSSIDRFIIDQKVVLHDPANGNHSVYVTRIVLDTEEITVSDTRGGAAVDLSTFATTNTICYHEGAESSSNQFYSIKSSLLSAANGGSATLHGQNKLLYPYLQAINIDGSTITASNILEKLFDAYTTIRRKARGKATDILVSYKHFASIMKLLEVQKGSYKVAEDTKAVNAYSWDSITIQQVSSTKTLKVVGIQEWDDDVIAFMDWSGLTFRSNGFIRKRTAPDGKQYYEMRTTNGFAYILDIFLFGELEFAKPSGCGIIHSIDY